jgi:sigma-B regulation protein RsbU (phosphoserine phosphatase)
VLRLLVQSAEDLTSTLRLEEVLRRVAARVRPLVDFHVFCVLVWNERTRLLEHKTAVCMGKEIKVEGSLRLGQGVSGTAAALRRSLLVPDVSRDERYVRFGQDEVEIRSALAIPLEVKGRLVGVLNLESAEPCAYTAQHEQFLTALASQIAVAVENARLYEALEAQERRLHREIAAAREIQNSLLPATGPETPGATIGTAYLPAAELGGDFFEFTPLPDGRLAVAIGDVSGKGVAAALYASTAVGMLRGQVLERPVAASQMLGHLNDQLHRRMADGRFIALIYAIWDGARRTLDLANAGFTQPILIRGGTLERIRVRGLPLGLFPWARYDETQVHLQSGDVVAFLSDGLQEAIDGQDCEFSERFLGDVARALAGLRAPEIAAGFLRANTAYAGEGEEHPDDRAVVVLKIS